MLKCKNKDCIQYERCIGIPDIRTMTACIKGNYCMYITEEDLEKRYGKNSKDKV